MLNKKKVSVVAASLVVAAPMLLTNTASAASQGILAKLENQLAVSRIMRNIEKLSMENGDNKDNARVAGFEGEHEAAKYIDKEFNKLGLESELRKIEGIDGFIDDGATLVVDGVDMPVKTMTFSQATNGVLEGELVYAGLGTADECKEVNLNGKIALIQRGTFSFAEKAKNAANNGAKAVIIYNNVEGMTNGTLGSFVDSVVPTVGMSLEDGSKLVERLNAGETIAVSKEVNTLAAPDSYSYNVVGRIPANKNVKNPKTIVIGAHFDGVSCPGANDNASGTATILEVARLLAQPEVKNKLQYNIEFVAFGAEEIGLIGSDEYVAQIVESGEAENVYGMINLDMVGTGDQIVTYNYVAEEDEVAHRMTNIAHENIEELGYDFGGHYRSGSSDHAPFEAAGIPAVFLQIDEDPYYHTDEDTVDKIDPQNIQNIATVVLNMVMDMQEVQPSKPGKPNKPSKPNNQTQKVKFENEEMPSK